MNASEITLKPWGKLELGTHSTARLLRKTIRVRRQNNILYGERMMFCDQFAVCPKAETVDVFLETPTSLGLYTKGKKATVSSAITEGLAMGLELSAEAGPQFLRQFGRSLPDGWYRVAMEPITYAEDASFIFVVEKYKGVAHLYVEWMDKKSSNSLSPDNPIIFIKRTKTPSD